MFVGRVRAVAFDAQSIQHRYAQGPDKISIGSATNTRFAQIEIQQRGQCPRLCVKRSHLLRAFQWRAIDPAAND